MVEQYYLSVKIIFLFLLILPILYFFLNFFLKKEYYFSIKFTFLLLLLFSTILVSNYIKDFWIGLLTAVTLLNFFYIFSVAIYTPKSSVRFNILKILYNNNKKISYLKLLNKYNDTKIVSKRLSRLLRTKTLIRSKKYFKINSLKGYFIVYVFLFLRKILLQNE
jgi:hypothetical protein